MTIFPAAAAFLAGWLLLSLRNASFGVLAVMAALPFGMFAAIRAGGSSLLMAHLLVLLTICLLLLRALAERAPARPLPPAAVWMIIFTGYTVFSAFVLVRLFQGSFMVFPNDVAAGGAPVSPHFRSGMVPLRPTGSNMAQAVYALLNCGFFLAVLSVARRHGPAFAERGMAWAAAVNILLGLLDFLSLDGLLALVRTADYALNNTQQMAGFARIIGGFAESSAFGAASAGFFAYFGMSALTGGRRRDAFLAAGSLACAALALSSTAILSLAAAILVILLHLRLILGGLLARSFGQMLVVAGASAVLVLCLLILLTPVLDMASGLLDRLVFSKGQSLSGLERGAWSASGFSAFVQTWGLGAGAGSLRSNGYAAVLLGSLGLPGAIAFCALLFHSAGRPPGPGPRNAEAVRIFFAARAGAATLLAAMLASATAPDPGLALAGLCALATAAREAALPVTARQQRAGAGNAGVF